MKRTPALLDHVVVITDDLSESVAQIAAATGVTLEPGGVHPHFGTRNYLASFGDGAYLELIGADAENVEFVGSRPFGIDEATGMVTATWAITPENIEVAVAASRDRGVDPGDPKPKSRRRPDGSLLEWKLTRFFAEPSGVVPFMLDWEGATTPAETTTAALTLVRMEAAHPASEEVEVLLGAIGTDLDVEQGPEKLAVTLEGPAGRITV